MAGKKSLEISNRRKDENYLVIYGWMTNQLKLSGNELLVYGLIYSFAKDDSAEFHGSAGYIATALNMTDRTVRAVLKKLTDKNLVEKRAAGRYRNYSITSRKNLPTSCRKNLPTSTEEFTGVSRKNFPSIAEEFTDHIKSIFKVDIKSGSSETTTTSLFIDICKSLGYSLDPVMAQNITAGMNPDWLSGMFSYPEYIAEVILENYVEKSPEEKRKLFITILAKEDRKDSYPAWRESKLTETMVQEDRQKRETAVEAVQKRIEEARRNIPEACENCGTALEPGRSSGQCKACGYSYYFNEDSKIYEFEEPVDLIAEFESRRRKQSQAENIVSIPPGFGARYDYIFTDLKNKAVSDEEADRRALESVNEEYRTARAVS